MTKRCLVIGARKRSLGDEISKRLKEREWLVETAGENEEDYRININSIAKVDRLFGEQGPYSAVICTVGVNRDTNPGMNMADLVLNLDRDMNTNATSHMMALSSWLKSKGWGNRVGHWVSISSNSARIARSNSLGYCMSKAALSMGIQSASRWAGLNDLPVAIWAVEPGWLNGTPMSEEVSMRLGGDVDPHRIPSGYGIDPGSLAGILAYLIDSAGIGMNGCLLRMDGGEQ